MRAYYKNHNYMKTLKQAMIALSLILVCGTASAFIPVEGQPDMPVIVSSCIDAVVYGKTEGLEEIIDNRAVMILLKFISLNNALLAGLIF